MNRYPFHGRKLPKPPEEESLNPFLFKSKEEKERILSDALFMQLLQFKRAGVELVAPDVDPEKARKAKIHTYNK